MVLSHQTGVRFPVALPTSFRAAVLLLAVAFVGFAAATASAQPGASSRSKGPAVPANVERLDSLAGITEYRLRSNGMRILLAPNRAAPVITFMVVYHVGSRNEAPGNTGSAHLLEHMLFNKSTANFGKANKKKTFQEVLYEAGADYATSNMTTWYDRMTGYSTLPSDRLDLAMQIEADRLGRALILDEERRPEMSVVRNEYEIRENSPYNALDKSVTSAAIVAHPYHWNTIGFRSDIEGVSTETLREHYRHFFHPDNAEAILVGDFDTAAALRLFDREFGKFPKSKSPVPTVITQEPPQEGERRVVVRRPGQLGIVQISYMRPNSLHPDFIPLDLLSTILSSGVNSRLYQELVETGLATDIASWNNTLRDPYPIVTQATIAPGTKHEAVEEALKAALYRIGRDGVSATELERAKNQLEVTVIRSRDGTYQLASQLGEAVASANWKWFVEYVGVLKKVTPDDVKRVAATYLVPDHATVGWFVPPEEAAPAVTKPTATKSKKRGAGGASEEASGSGFGARTVRRILSNGMIVDVVRNPAVPTMALQGTIFAGRMDAPAGKTAVPQLTAMMLTRGTTARDKRAIGAALDNVGAQLTIGADAIEASVFGSGLARDLRLVLGILAEELRTPAFADSELVKTKAEFRADVLRASDNTGQRARDRLTQLVYGDGHPFRAPSKDAMLASIDATTAADLRAFWRERYVGAGTVLAIVGDVDPEATLSLVDSLFGAIPKGARPAYERPRTEPNAAVSTVETMKGKANMDFVLGHASSLRRADPDYEAALIANAALGQSSLTSRIGKRVRDTEGLSYTLFSRYLSTDYLDGVWMVDVAVAPQNLTKALRSTKEEIDKYRREGITDAEVETQKSFFAGNYLVRLGTNAGVATALCTAERFGFGPSYLDEFPKRIRAVTKAQADAVIRTRLHPDKMHLIVAGDLTEPPQ